MIESYDASDVTTWHFNKLNLKWQIIFFQVILFDSILSMWCNVDFLFDSHFNPFVYVDCEVANAISSIFAEIWDNLLQFFFRF